MKFHPKGILSLLFIVLCYPVFAQSSSINQYDQQGQRHGVWKKYYEGTRQLRYTGTFKHGEEVGTFKFYKPQSQEQPAATKTFSSTSDTVVVKYYNPEGVLTLEGKMLHKKRIGQWRYYRQNTEHQLMMTEHYKMGELNGWKILYHPNGQVFVKKEYQNGLKNGKKLVYDKNGVLRQKFHYLNDTLEGASTLYDAKGRPVREGAFKSGVRDGKWKFYDNGKLDHVQEYPMARGVQIGKPQDK